MSLLRAGAGGEAARPRLEVAVLGATGAVGQRMVQLLANHPWFELAGLVASERSAGRPYAEAVRWVLADPIPECAAGMEVLSLGSDYPGVVAFSALDAAVAAEAEVRAARRGLLVVSNARCHRMEPDVPLLIPEVNPSHLALLEMQEDRFGSGGRILTNPNCSTIGLVLALAPLQQTFGIEAVHVTTLQALSGAGYPGIPSYDLTGNVIPHIGGEEEKLETEPLKILGTLEQEEAAGRARWSVTPADIAVSASVHRVPVVDGHLESVAVRLRRTATVDEVAEAFAGFGGLPQERGLPTAPARPLVVLSGEDRPQPRRDRDLGGGMTVSVGRIREDAILGIKFSLLVHNTIRGAAGAAILNAELAVDQLHNRGCRDS